MASKQQERSRKNRQNSAPEPISARILQVLILVAGVLLLLTVFFGGRWGPALTGMLIFVTALPQIRKGIDHWLLGKKNAPGSEQASQIRMVIGGILTILSLSGVFL